MIQADLEAQIRRELPNLTDEGVREVARAVHRLIESFQPEEIYVFGSQARGTARLDSDVDLLVVVAQSDLPPHRRDQEAYRVVGPHQIPLDILVITRDEFERDRTIVASLPWVALGEGRLLYAA